jgi:hypothetical protein
VVVAVALADKEEQAIAKEENLGTYVHYQHVFALFQKWVKVVLMPRSAWGQQTSLGDGRH